MLLAGPCPAPGPWEGDGEMIPACLEIPPRRKTLSTSCSARSVSAALPPNTHQTLLQGELAGGVLYFLVCVLQLARLGVLTSGH